MEKTEGPLGHRGSWGRVAFLGVCSVAAVAVIAAGVGWWTWYVPNRNLSRQAWLERASRLELKETSERILRWPWGNHHDACLYLKGVGDAGSVPIIRRALGWVDDSGPGRVASCTFSHCREALAALERVPR